MSKTTYLDFLDGVKAYYGTGSDQWAEIAKYGLKADNALDILSQIPEVNVIKNANGTVRGITYKDFTSWGGYPSNIGNALNSNNLGGSASPNKSFNMSIPSNTKVNETTKTLEMTSEIGKKVSTGQKVIGTLATIGQAVFAVGAACTLGKIIDKTLYNLNPDFWNAHDMETLNPDVWGEITNSGSTGDDIFNALMGVDPVTNETTAYVDENALAYMALYLQEKGIFESSNYYELDNTDNIPYTEIKNRVNKFVLPVSMPVINYGECSYLTTDGRSNFTAFKSDKSVPTALLKRNSSSSFWVMGYSSNNFKWGVSGSAHHIPSESFSANTDAETYTYDNKTVYLYDRETPMVFNQGTSLSINTFQYNEIKANSGNIQKEDLKALAWALLFYSTLHSGGLDGVSSQDNATIPDLSGANSVKDALNILKNTLPNIFNNAITNSVPQPDGSIKDYTYVPISLPNTNNNNDPQPETGNQTQAKPQVNPETSPDTLLDLIIKLFGNKLDTPNPPDTGTGNTPPVVLPTGSADALYKIYNPTQAEINSFGAWLWSSNFVDQLLKVFNNPMESIIGLHKVYASPIIGGRSNIKVGYLDSGVNSNFVSNQYTKIDCGTVNLQEYFGNVFDYSPYTSIELYLPCIGFVQLDVGNVMRSSINITYTVDVLTGACLAEVNVKRDNSGGVLYSYSGNCASQYPLSSGSYMGIISSVIGVAGSIVGTVASGGSLAPLALGATSGLLNAKTHVQHSGSLSGNSGVMGGKIPYLIITRPQTNMAENYQHLQGIPSNTYTQLSACRGFVKVKNVNVQNIIAESEELEEIKTLLLDGVII
jgi:hypothetical protein